MGWTQKKLPDDADLRDGELEVGLLMRLANRRYDGFLMNNEVNANPKIARRKLDGSGT